MALVTQRLYRGGRGRRMKRAAWGFTAQKDGKQVRQFREDWTKDDAEQAMAAWLRGETPTIAVTPSPIATGMTLGAMVEKFLAEKRAEGKRSIGDDEERSRPLLEFFGED